MLRRQAIVLRLRSNPSGKFSSRRTITTPDERREADERRREQRGLEPIAPVQPRARMSATVSTVSPAATAATSVATSIRVPVMHGLPNRMSGSIEMPGNISVVFVYCF